LKHNNFLKNILKLTNSNWVTISVSLGKDMSNDDSSHYVIFYCKIMIFWVHKQA